MALRTLLRSVCLAEPWRPPHRSAGRKSIAFSPSSSMRLCGDGGGGVGTGGSRLRCGCESVRFSSFRKQALRFNCSSNHNSSSFHTSSDSDGDGHEQGPPQEAVLKAISEVSKTEGRVGQTTNVIIGGTVADDSTNEWLALDQKVNSYPTVRGFTAIGTGGDDFVQSMIVAVESVLQQPIPEGRIKQKVSSRGKYISVNIGPVRVISSEQVQAIYNAMRRDDRMKYFL